MKLKTLPRMSTNSPTITPYEYQLFGEFARLPRMSTNQAISAYLITPYEYPFIYLPYRVTSFIRYSLRGNCERIAKTILTTCRNTAADSSPIQGGYLERKHK